MKQNERILTRVEVIRLVPNYSRHQFKVIAHYNNGEEHFWAKNVRHKNMIVHELNLKYKD